MSERERLVFIIKNQLYINFLSEDVAQLDLNMVLLPHLAKLSRDLLMYVATYC